MKKTIFIKRIAVMLLATVLVLGSSLTAFAATVEQTNPKTTGVQLIGNTLLVNEDNHMMYVWGKSVMLQCPGVTDVLPNNNTKLVDVQFNGNLYKGIEEILIVKTQGKDDKIRLEEGSMIVTGVTTPEQVQKVKSALKAMPTNLAELKYALIGTDVTLGATKNYIVEKDSVKNESGAKVDPKSIEGTVELINTQTVTQTPTESKPEEKKGEPGSSLSPPRHLCNHVFDFEGRPYVKCLSCGESSPFSIGCTHVWNTEGKCTRCNRYCVHEFPEGEVGAPCKICGYQSTMAPCQHEFDVDGNHYVVCTKCGAPNPTCGGCNHNWDSSTGICTECSGDCLHQFPQGTTGAACTVCGFNGSIPPTPCSHPSYNYLNDAKHKCTVCGKEESHDYEDGYCSICQHNCQHTGQSAGETCRYCVMTVPSASTCSIEHSIYCPGINCPECDEPGTGNHEWDMGRCTRCGDFCEHTSWTDAVCDVCSITCGVCNGEGAAGGCNECGKIASPTPTHNCDTDGHEWDSSTGICNYCHASCNHSWAPNAGYCDECLMVCPTCHGEGTSYGCATCNKSS